MQSLAGADPAAVGAAAYVETALAAADLIARTPARDPARRAAAARLVALGLPLPAPAALAPALALDDPAARLVAAEAELALGETEAVRAILGGLGRAQARSRCAPGPSPSTADMTRRSRCSPKRACGGSRRLRPALGRLAAGARGGGRSAATAMAGHMTARTGTAGAPAPSSDPAALAPDAAFQELLPSLAGPSLGAARRLLSTGLRIGGFVSDVLSRTTGRPAGQPPR